MAEVFRGAGAADARPGATPLIVKTDTFTYTYYCFSRFKCFNIMAKLADARDLKSAGPKGLWGFDSPSRHQPKDAAVLQGLRKVFVLPSAAS